MRDRKVELIILAVLVVSFASGIAFGQEPSRERDSYNRMRAVALECTAAKGRADWAALLPENPAQVDLPILTRMAVRINTECQALPASPAPAVEQQPAPRARGGRGSRLARRGPLPTFGMVERIDGAPYTSAFRVENTWSPGPRNPRTLRHEPGCYLKIRVGGTPAVFEIEGEATEFLPPGEKVEVALPFSYYDEEGTLVEYECYPEVCGWHGPELYCDIGRRPVLAGRNHVQPGDRIEPGTLGALWNRPVRLATGRR